MQQRNQSGQCDFANRLERVADVLFSRISGHMTASEWEASQITLWSFYQALLAELREKGRFHYSSPAGSPHRCLSQAYEDAKATLLILEQTSSAPSPPPAPPPNPRSLADVLRDWRDAARRADNGGE
jgi:hypothetical protein